MYKPVVQDILYIYSAKIIKSTNHIYSEDNMYVKHCNYIPVNTTVMQSAITIKGIIIVRPVNVVLLFITTFTILVTHCYNFTLNIVYLNTVQHLGENVKLH